MDASSLYRCPFVPGPAPVCRVVLMILLVLTTLAAGSTPTSAAQVPDVGQSAPLHSRSTGSIATAPTAAGLSATAVVVGSSHTCALTSTGAVYCWGNNYSGQLGDGTKIDSRTPVMVTGLSSNVSMITAGWHRTCALTSSGEVYCWGNDSLTPTAVGGLSSDITAIAADSSHTCALTSGGEVYCWGYNSSGQLGDGTTENRQAPVAVVGLGSDVTDITVGSSHTCALTSGGEVYCWGYNSSGQLGDGTKDERLTPVAVESLSSGVSVIDAGDNRTCALTSVGAVYCWGGGSLTPTAVEGLSSDVSAIAVGSGHSCVLTDAGGVYCWGNNGSGQLGDGTKETRQTPVAVMGLNSDVIAIAVSGNYAGYTCAVTSAGGVRCWGDNYAGQLGNGTAGFSQTPVEVVGLSSSVKAVAAGLEHTCALTSVGTVYCWGSNEYGQLGDGTTIDRRTPVVVMGLNSYVKTVSAGPYHTCAVTKEGSAYCWGNNESGQLGDGTEETRIKPVAVAGLNSGVSAITAGGATTGGFLAFTCALTEIGGVYCWGSNWNDQLGDGTHINSQTPVAVVGLSSGVRAIAAASSHACAVMSAGGVRCWGNNSVGQLGDGTTIFTRIPVEVVGLSSDVISIAAAGTQVDWVDYPHTCVITAVGDVYCWGSNLGGQLGDGETQRVSSTPVAVVGLNDDISAIGAGAAFTCALTEIGGVYCWGRNNGQLGDGTTEQRETPVAVVGLQRDVSAIDVGYYHTCAVTNAGGVRCWGNNKYGQLGDGTTGRMPFPVAVIGFGEAYTISGQITGSNNNTVVDAIVSDGIRITTTDSNGNYTLSNVPAGSYTLTPEKIGYTFTPATRSVTVSGDVSGQDFTATATASPFTLESNVTTGAPGSVFVLAAHNFPPNSQAVISLKAPGMPTFKEMLRQTMDAEGHLVFLFLTGADNPPGAYTIRLNVQTAATGLAEEMVQETTITLADDAPQRTDRPADDVPTVDVNALSGSIYLPLVIR